MSIEAMKLALDALEEINKLSIGEKAICLPAEIDTAMDALRTAIEQAEKQEPVACQYGNGNYACCEGGPCKAEEQNNAAAPVQEPVIDHSCKDTYELIMKWADIYAAQTGNLYAQAAQDPSKVARMADERTMLACVVAQAISQLSTPTQKREHITDGSPCWCNPETNYVDPETGIAVIVHKEPQ